MMKIIIEDNQNIRLDSYLFNYLENKTRSYIQNLIKEGHILVNGKIVKTGYKLKKDDILSVFLPEVKKLDLTPVEMDLNIVYEDDDLVAINKPKNLVVHPASSFKDNTLVHGLLHQIKDLSNINGIIRPGIVHRLDKDTTGLIIIAKNDHSHKRLSDDFKERNVKRYYKALVHGVIKDDLIKIDAPIKRDPNNRLKMKALSGGREAITLVKVLKRFENYTLIEAELITGRTHQIRVHLSFINYPIVGDILYGYKKDEYVGGQLLHAYKLEFLHPTTKEKVNLSIDLPIDFEDFLKTIV